MGTRILPELKRHVSHIWEWINQGNRALIFSIIYTLITFLLVYLNPRDIISFLLFMASIFLIFSLPYPQGSKWLFLFL
jgi:hypothetical protein